MFNFTAFFSDSDDGRTRRARMREVVAVQRMEWQAHDLEIGFAYDAGAVIPDGSDAPERDPMGVVYHPTTRPGHRLPHAWLTWDGRQVSTHDLVPRDSFLLLLGSQGDGWLRAAADIARRYDIPLLMLSVGPQGDLQDVAGDWTALRQVGEAGALLIRPDNHVSWRAAEMQNPVAALDEALRDLLDQRSLVLTD